MTFSFQKIRRMIVLTMPLAFAPLLWSQADAQNAVPRSKPELEQLVAPIALYPDDLMSQVLMASTYPLEVVEAARWSHDHKDITGKTLEDAMAKESWDPSVKALAAVPQTLQMMNDKLTWTQQLGDAFLAQQQDVLDAIQRLRQRADEAGNLKTTPQQVVRKTASTSGSASSEPAIYAIAPTDPDVTYVPIYDPGVVYGAWPYADYEPFYWYPSGFVASNVLSFAAGIATGAAIWAGVDWWRRDVNINVNRYNQFNRTRIASNTWAHDPAHRGAVPYHDRAVADKFGEAHKAASRDNFRERSDAGRRELSNNPAARDAARNAGSKKAGDKIAARHPGTGEHANAGSRERKAGQPSRNKPSAQKRPGAQNRAVARPEHLNRARVAQRPEVAHAGARNMRPAGGMHAGGGGGGRAARGGGGRRR